MYTLQSILQSGFDLSDHPNRNLIGVQGDLFLKNPINRFPKSKGGKRNLAKELFNFIHLEIAFNDVQEFFKLFNQYLLSEKDRYVLRTATDKADRYLYFLIVIFSPFFIRPPRTIPETGDYKKVLDHLFAEYKVPDFLYQEWLKPFDSVNFKWIAWFILFGQGFSLKKAGKLFDWHYPRRFQSKLWEVPENFTPEEACAYAFIKRIGGTDRDVDLILEEHVFSYKVDPTEGRENQKDDFVVLWKEVVEWLIRRSNELSDNRYRSIIKLALYLYNHKKWILYSLKSFKHLRPNEVLKSAKKRELIEKKLTNQPINWRTHNLDWTYHDSSQSTWFFSEINNEAELSKEGTELAHCVKTYLERCFLGKIAIVSLSHNDKKCITIELSLGKIKVVQIAGYCNRMANDDEWRVIMKWAEEIEHRINRRKIPEVSFKNKNHSILKPFQTYQPGPPI